MRPSLIVPSGGRMGRLICCVCPITVASKRRFRSACIPFEGHAVSGVSKGWAQDIGFSGRPSSEHDIKKGEGPKHPGPSESFCTEAYGVTGVGALFGVLR